MRVLIVGLGSIARKHIEAIKKINANTEFFALRRESSLSSEEGIINIFEINEVKLIDFAIISNPTSKHASTISDLLELNVPLFIEKPLFSNLNHQILVEKVKLQRIPTYIACNLRFLESLVFVQKFLNEKRINEVNAYCGSYLPSWRPGIDFRSVYSANKEMGGGVHIDLIHEIDYITWLFGFPKSSRKEFTSKSTLEITACDYANYLLSYDSFSVNVILNYYRKTAKRSLEVVCEDGECHVDLLKNEVFWNDEKVFSSNQRIADTYLLQMDYFIENVVKKSVESSFNNVDNAYKVLKICLEN